MDKVVARPPGPWPMSATDAVRLPGIFVQRVVALTPGRAPSYSNARQGS